MDVANPGLRRLGPDVIVSINLKLAEAEERIDARPGSESRVELGGTDRRSALVRQAALIESLRTRGSSSSVTASDAGAFVVNGAEGPGPSLADLAQHLSPALRPRPEIDGSSPRPSRRIPPARDTRRGTRWPAEDRRLIANPGRPRARRAAPS